jgi:hypothetical protein
MQGHNSSAVAACNNNREGAALLEQWTFQF